MFNADFLDAIKNLSDKMTISRVVAFFERFGAVFTKTMIQNYIRVGVLPPPRNNRHYTKNHLLLLHLINAFKSVYSLDEIKLILTPFINAPNEADIPALFLTCAAFCALCEKNAEETVKNLSEAAAPYVSGKADASAFADFYPFVASVAYKSKSLKTPRSN